MRVAVAKAHPLAARKSCAPRDLDGQRLVFFTRADYPEYWESVKSWFKTQGVDAKVAGEYDGVSSLMAAVEAGLGIALVAEGSHQLAPPGVVLRPISPEPAPVPIAAGISPAKADARTAVFVEELRRAASVAANQTKKR
jgi:DNA-binding transcriptional LysR family regulator